MAKLKADKEFGKRGRALWGGKSPLEQIRASRPRIKKSRTKRW